MDELAKLYSYTESIEVHLASREFYSDEQIGFNRALSRVQLWIQTAQNGVSTLNALTAHLAARDAERTVTDRAGRTGMELGNTLRADAALGELTRFQAADAVAWLLSTQGPDCDRAELASRIRDYEATVDRGFRRRIVDAEQHHDNPF